MIDTASEELVIIGAGFFSMEINDLVKSSTRYDVVGYVEGIDRERCKSAINDLPVFWIDEFINAKKTAKCIAAIGSPKRKNIIKLFEDRNFQFIKLIHHSAQIFFSSKISTGSIIGAGVIISAGCRIEEHVIVNRGCLIGHHTRIGKYVTISPGANIAGKVEIAEGAYIGMGSIIIDGIKIGKDSIVAAGAVVTKDVPDNVQVVGVPAKITKSLI